MTDISDKADGVCGKSVKLLPTLKTRKEFLAVRSGKRHVSENFILQAKLNESSPGTLHTESRAGSQAGLGTGLRVGYTITNKVGNSVVRNRIKRRLKCALSAAIEQILQRPSAGNVGRQSIADTDLVLVAKRSALTTSFATLVGELTKGIDRLVTKGNKAA